MAAAAVVFRKEMRDHLRDRRSIYVAMIYPLMGPLLLGLMFAFVGGLLKSGAGAARGPAGFPLAVLHLEAAPALAKFLTTHEVAPMPAPADAAEAVKHGALPVVVVPRQPSKPGGPLEVTVLSNPSRLDSIVATGRVLDLLHRFAQERTEARLASAGVDPKLANPVDIVERKVGSAAGFAGIMLTMIPPFLMFTLFIGGVHVVLDATSGERERGSFEPLLINPVTRRQVLIGKLGAGFVFTLMALGAQLLAFWLMLSLVSVHLGGIAPPPEPLRLLLLVPVSLPVALLAVATQLMISAFTRSMKEAQTYLGLLPLAPGIAGMVLALAPVQVQPLLAAIPTFGQTLLMGQVVRHEQLSGSLIGISIVATLAATILLLALAFRLYQREEILFPK